MTLQEKLAAGIAQHGAGLCRRRTQQKLLDYLALLAKWNRCYNLTAVRDPEEMVTQHLLDSLSVLPHMDGRSPARRGQRRRPAGHSAGHRAPGCR